MCSFILLSQAVKIVRDIEDRLHGNYPKSKGLPLSIEGQVDDLIKVSGIQWFITNLQSVCNIIEREGAKTQLENLIYLGTVCFTVNGVLHMGPGGPCHTTREVQSQLLESSKVMKLFLFTGSEQRLITLATTAEQRSTVTTSESIMPLPMVQLMGGQGGLEGKIIESEVSQQQLAQTYQSHHAAATQPKTHACTTTAEICSH